MVSLVNDYSPDVLLIAEPSTNPDDFAFKINPHIKQPYSLPIIHASNPDFVFLIRMPEKSMEIRHEATALGVCITRLQPPMCSEIILIVVHLKGKSHESPESQAHLATRIQKIIEDAESKLGHRRTVIVGDFNMNPFESGMVSSESFHAIVDRNLLSTRASRTVIGEEKRFFYNPMWQVYSQKDRPYGTYYHDKGGDPLNYYWNVFDQVIMRPDMLPFFRDDSLRLIIDSKEERLLDHTRKPNEKISDHLPIMFDLDIEQ